MSTTHTIREGESLSSIARWYGFASWRAIWDLPENERFREDHPDPGRIRPGEVVRIPVREVQPVELQASAGQKKITVRRPRSLATVAFLQGDRDEAGARAVQYVNLAAEERWVELDPNRVRSKDRLGTRPRVKVAFDAPVARAFKLKLVRSTRNVRYTSGEKGRNERFRYEKREREYTTGADGTKIVDDVALDVGGGNAFRVLVRADDRRETQALTVRRLVYLQELRMDGVPAARHLAKLVGEYRGVGIDLARRNPASVDRIPNVNTRVPAELDRLRRSLRDAYVAAHADQAEPHVLAVAYLDQIAVKSRLPERRVPAIAGRTVTVPVLDRNGDELPLWKDVVPGEGWFVSARFERPGPPGRPPASVVIPAARCKPSPDRRNEPAYAVEVDLHGLGPRVPDGTQGAVVLNLDVVLAFLGGVSAGDGNLVCIATRGFWKASSHGEQNLTLMHELGHALGMVPEGPPPGAPIVAAQAGYDGLDAHPAVYTGHGHRGRHCHAGLALPAGDFTDAQEGACVMFGYRIRGSGKGTRFCDDCRSALRKLDLSHGWRRF